MPNRDLRSDVLNKLAFNADITTDTTTNGDIIDTQEFGTAMFTIFSPVYTDGPYTPVLEESDDSGMSGANDVADDNLIGTEVGAVISAVTAGGASLVSIGAFGTKRFLRLKITSASTSTGARINSIFTGNPLLMPSNDLSA